ncbi:cupin domain-containing protein [Ancylobacter sonchi]|uniref:(R)-mandelonitrile lyase n=1 Tax=Ancylobacter sonchi TaxID=1937790 RepID=UPI001BD2666E|nr:cupin domain-containing protein [Ancylobacter sonchi]MBS7534739.1 cupin domain-containing protein [Ancylobacter sonchi]
MKKTILAASSLVLAGVAPASAQSIQVTEAGSNRSIIAPAQNFSGTAAVTPLFPGNAETHATGGLVNFTPGARTAWHTHPAGQMLIITSGRGWVQEEGRERIVVRAGDVVWIPVGVKHWHGATASDAMAHIALSYMKDGNNVTWMEQVTDEQYAAP